MQKWLVFRTQTEVGAQSDVSEGARLTRVKAGVLADAEVGACVAPLVGGESRSVPPLGKWGLLKV